MQAPASSWVEEDKAWVASVVGGKVTRFERTSTGASRGTWLVDVTLPDGTERALVLRRDTGDGPLSRTELSLEREGGVYRALAGSGVLIPRLVAVSSDKQALLVERAPGTEAFAVLSPAERTPVVTSFIEALAALHNLDPEPLDLPMLGRPRTGPEHALFELDLWQRVLDARVRRPAPLVRFAFAWMRAHVPTHVSRTVVCHGDVGPGNFLFADGKVTAILDWEFSHLGDPMDDIGWLTIRGNHLQGFGDPRETLALYSQLTGIPVDTASVRYYQAFVLLRMAVCCLVALDGRTGAMDVSVHFNLLPALDKLLPELLADIAGVAIPAIEAPAAARPGPTAEVLDFLLSDLAVIGETVTSPSALARLHGASALLLHLQAAAQLGPALDADSCRELSALLGQPLTDLEEGLRELDSRIVAGKAPSEQELLRFFGRFGQRRALLWPANAAFAARPIPPLEI